MSSECVRCSPHQVMTELDADLFSCGSHLCIEPLRLFPAAKFGRAINPPIQAPGSHLRVKLEGMPTHIQRASQHRGNSLDAALCDKAPWTDQIRSHVDDQTIRV